MSAVYGPDGISNLPGGYYRRVLTGTVTTNDNSYVRFGRCSNGAGFCGAMGFSVTGTTDGTVAGCNGIAFANHSMDGSINIQNISYYSGIKIKLVSNGNQSFDLYVAVNTSQNRNITMTYQIWEINGNIQHPSDAGTAYNTAYITSDGGDIQTFASSGMTGGSGPSGY
jgi:hypothetical protein